MAILSVKTIAAACGIQPPISLKQDVLGFDNKPTNSLKEQLAWMQAQCMPWEVIVPDSKKMAVHAALLPTGKSGEIIYFGGSKVEDSHIFDVKTYEITEDFSHGPYCPEELDPKTVNTNTFCSGHAFLADGRLLVVGGQLHLFQPNCLEIDAPPQEEQPHPHPGMGWGGSRACWTYNPQKRVWRKASSLNPDPAGNPGGGRWYPGAVTLADGEVLAVGGHPDRRENFISAGSRRHNNNTPERYSPVKDSWTLLTGATTAINGIRDEYQRIHLLPNGLVFFSTVVKGHNRIYNPHVGTFLDKPFILPPLDKIYHQGSNASSVLLPLLPGDNYTPRVLVCGGKQPMRINLGAESPINLSDASANWESAGKRDWGGIPPLPPPERNHLCATLFRS